MKKHDIRRELELFLLRSHFIQSIDKPILTKFRKVLDIIVLRQGFADILEMEHEHNLRYIDLVQLLTQELHANKLVSWTVLHLTRSMSDSLKVWNSASHLKWGSSALLIQLWKALTLSVDCTF